MDNESCLLWFRRVAFWEGVSYILLLGVAMPIKYVGGIEEPVRYVGWAHGLLFMAYAGMLLLAWQRFKWGIGRVALFFLASLLPFAPFWVERSLKEESARA